MNCGNVKRKIFPFSETLLTEFAGERFLLMLRPHVVRQEALPLEGWLTDPAPEFGFVWMADLDVIQKAFSGSKSLWAVTTVLFISSCRFSVNSIWRWILYSSGSSGESWRWNCFNFVQDQFGNSWSGFVLWIIRQFLKYKIIKMKYQNTGTIKKIFQLNRLIIKFVYLVIDDPIRL